MNAKEKFNPEFLRYKRQNKNKELKCKDCRYFINLINFCGEIAVNCMLTHTIVLGTGCDLKNVDISDEKICFNCKHYLGGNDWGLSCAKEYHKLVDAFDEACKNFEKQ